MGIQITGLEFDRPLIKFDRFVVTMALLQTIAN
jgi:hypothetical protein